MKSNAQHPCTFCGKPHSTPYAGGEWHTPDGFTVYCCPTCATEVLPALIADSVHAMEPAYKRGCDILPLIERTFWRSWAARITSSRGAK